MFWNELIRKSIHMSSLVIPVSVLFLDIRWIRLILLGLTCIAFLVEWARFNWSPFRAFFKQCVGSLLRKHEEKGLTGATCLLISSTIAVFAFDNWIIITSLCFLMISDAMGALVGRFIGRIQIAENRTLEGSLAFLISGLIVVYFVPGTRFEIAIPGAIVASLVEIFIRQIDDNIAIPLISGFFMQGLVLIF